jgi:hypothetical protein
MTMLDQMRQHKNWLKWSLGLVILTFRRALRAAVPQTAGRRRRAGRRARHRERPPGHLGTYQRIYNQQLAQMRSAYAS